MKLGKRDKQDLDLVARKLFGKCLPAEITYKLIVLKRRLRVLNSKAGRVTHGGADEEKCLWPR